MDIKEFYISDKDGGYNSDFWSKDKITKLNANFISLANGGLGEGQIGIQGGIGVSGDDGAGGNTGQTGQAGPDGVVGPDGLNLWERIEDTVNAKLIAPSSSTVMDVLDANG